jgi:hypothetical protein
VNAGKAAVAVPSLTEIEMFANVPVAVGVPDSLPVCASKAAHAGRFVTLNVNGLPSGSLAVGVKVYALPTITDVGGVPVIVGGRFVGVVSVTVTSNGGSSVCVAPSDTHTTTPRWRPMFVRLGEPESCPVFESNVAHDGFASMPNTSASPSGSDAVGVNE